jgi:hypothetical protein
MTLLSYHKINCFATFYCAYQRENCKQLNYYLIINYQQNKYLTITSIDEITSDSVPKQFGLFLTY